MSSCSHAVSFNRGLDVCKLTGAVLFCVGGTSMAVGLLLSAFAKSYSKEELYLQQKFKERLADLHATVGELSFSTCSTLTGWNTEWKVPDRMFYCYCGNHANLHQAGHRGQSQLTVAAKWADLKPDHMSSDGSTDPFLWIQLENLTEGTLFHLFPLQSTLQPTSTPGLWLAFFFMQYLAYLLLFLLLLMPALSSLH